MKTIVMGLAVTCLALLLAAYCWRKTDNSLVLVQTSERNFPADGGYHPIASVKQRGNTPVVSSDLDVAGMVSRVVADAGGDVTVEVQAPVQPSQKVIVVRLRRKMFRLHLQFSPISSDRFGDGTPDFLRLHTDRDRLAFRSWFTALADDVAVLPPKQVPAEIDDCAALLRWCYRNALHAHDEAWLSTMPAEIGADLPSVGQYQYPDTPLGPSLFRVLSGPYQADDVRNGAFAQFADAKTVWLHNTFFISRDIRAARQGDLLFYRQLEQNSPYHSMVLTGAAHDWVVYHTGPIGSGPGEVRRVAMGDLLHHPDSRWRPVPENSNFLGVYRWNILREEAR
jgi:uncharacterized protein YfaT (DUF1175 family)